MNIRLDALGFANVLQTFKDLGEIALAFAVVILAAKIIKSYMENELK